MSKKYKFGDNEGAYVYSSAINYAGEKGLLNEIVIFRMFC